MQRMSSRPVRLDYLAKYTEEWEKACDAVQTKYGRDMLKVHKMLNYLEARLQTKYPNIEEIDVPSNAEDWKAIITKYEANGIMMARHANGKDVVAIIIDQAIM